MNELEITSEQVLQSKKGQILQRLVSLIEKRPYTEADAECFMFSPHPTDQFREMVVYKGNLVAFIETKPVLILY